MRKITLFYDYEAYWHWCVHFVQRLSLANPAFRISTEIFRIVVLKVNLIFALHLNTFVLLFCMVKLKFILWFKLFFHYCWEFDLVYWRYCIKNFSVKLTADIWYLEYVCVFCSTVNEEKKHKIKNDLFLFFISSEKKN